MSETPASASESDVRIEMKEEGGKYIFLMNNSPVMSMDANAVANKEIAESLFEAFLFVAKSCIAAGEAQTVKQNTVSVKRLKRGLEAVRKKADEYVRSCDSYRRNGSETSASHYDGLASGMRLAALTMEQETLH